jgi:hypothetical protein
MARCMSTLMIGFFLVIAGCTSLPRTASDSMAVWSEAPVFALDDDEEGPVDISWTILMYIPNRVLDAFDMVRARIRLGPGFALGARATEYADVFLGAYTSIYVGLPGPRGRRIPRLPAGLESNAGAEVSIVDGTIEGGGVGLDYGETEFGFDFQLALIGIGVGVDPYEILDFVVGFVGFDPLDDDF